MQTEDPKNIIQSLQRHAISIDISHEEDNVNTLKKK